MTNAFKQGRIRIRSSKTRKSAATQRIPPKTPPIRRIFIPNDKPLPTWEEMQKMVKDASHG